MEPGESRPSITHKFQVGSTKGFITVALENGRPQDVFIELDKEGSTLGGWLRAWAILFSIALQAGVPLEKLVGHFEGWQFGEWGPTANPDILVAQSIPDYLARWLKLRFCKKKIETEIENEDDDNKDQ